MRRLRGWRRRYEARATVLGQVKRWVLAMLGRAVKDVPACAWLRARRAKARRV
jgi:hypothetical protein